MPSYDMRCNQCGDEFTAMVSIKAKEEGKIECPQCGSKDVKQVFKAVNFIKDGSGSSSSHASGSSCGVGGCGSCHACSA